MSVLPLVLAAAQAHLGLFTAMLVVGVVIGIAGHIMKMTWLIILGILIIGLVSAYFSFVLQPS